MFHFVLGEQEEGEKSLSEAGSNNHYYTNESLSSVTSEPEQMMERRQPFASSVLEGIWNSVLCADQLVVHV